MTSAYRDVTKAVLTESRALLLEGEADGRALDGEAPPIVDVEAQNERGDPFVLPRAGNGHLEHCKYNFTLNTPTGLLK